MRISKVVFAGVALLSAGQLCATQTAAEKLRRNLLEIGRSPKFIWGHTIDQGDWNDPVKLGRLRRETGISPVLYATDFRNCFGTFYSPEHYVSNCVTLAALIKREYDERHAVPVISWHFANPYTPPGWKAYSRSAQPFRYRYGVKGHRQKEPYPEEHRWVLREIVEGTGGECGIGREDGSVNERAFPNPRAWYEWNLKEGAAFCRSLVGKDGKRIPLMFRFFHECECDWFWWGSGSSTPEDYIAAWRLTVDILRRELGRENVLFCYCTDRKWGKIGEEGKSGFLARYPGDDYIDVIGYDDYELGEDRNPKDGKHIDASKSSAAVANRMRLISAEGERRGKICGIFECGIMSAGGHYAGVDAFYSELRKVMSAPGVKFAFAHTYTGKWTYPHNEAGWADMRAVLKDPCVITDRRGIDLLDGNMGLDASSVSGGDFTTRITWETLSLFCHSNVADVKEPVRGIVVEHHGLGCVRFKPNEQAGWRKDLAEKGIVIVHPHYNPWCWMNDAAVRFSDRIVDCVIAHYGLAPDVKVCSKGDSMGGLGALVYARYSRKNVVAAIAKCPVCDLPYHYTERPDLPRTLTTAFADAPDFAAALKAHSPIDLVPQMPDISYFVAHSSADKSVNKERHSDRFVEAMHKAGRRIDYAISEGTGHCCLTPDVQRRFDAAVLSVFQE